MTDLTALRELVARMTPGPWYLTGPPWFQSADGVIAGSPDGNIGFIIADCDDWGVSREEYTENGDGPFKLGDKEDDALGIVIAHRLLTYLADPKAEEELARIICVEGDLAPMERWREYLPDAQAVLALLARKAMGTE
jgi:hypothetical protein